jgi:hypothetical protein
MPTSVDVPKITPDLCELLAEERPDRHDLENPVVLEARGVCDGGGRV